MKKIIYSAIAIMTIGFANAQDKSTTGFAKGDVYASGSFMIKSVSNGGTSESTIMPAVGFFVTEAISIEASVGIMSGIGGVNGSKATAFGVGAAYNFNAGNQFSTNVNLGLAMANADNNGAKASATVLNLGYGMRYFVSSKFALTANLGALRYTSVKPDGGTATTMTEFGLDLSNIAFGLVYKF